MTRPLSARLGRPRGDMAESHRAILDAVHDLLQETSVRDLTMEAVARRAGVGKPTLYKWWSSKAALVFSMFHERLAHEGDAEEAATVEAALRTRMKHLIHAFNGLFGRVMAELIAEGQSDPALLRELYDRHISPRRTAIIADIERGKASGEFASDTNAELLVDTIFGPPYYRLLLRTGPLTETYGDDLIDQVLRSAPMALRKSSPG
ncbi:TetR/AcrR family transcriptional regulator [Acidisoma cladoniae]|jgi:AcrR family transcriptional regulator|uniref:TetR/AcrR family transcriptional regulator n=1 Tax=Acidisoma cladoniae TaxID=3040935 RepID=UPI00254E903B|nr:TetR/AcrR family transcriptional regulator [Acidisoma sp. PAMC 29798]